MSRGERTTDKPARARDERRWFQEAPSSYPWEQDGLDHIRRLMPKAEPYRAWATFSFTAASGRINECDLLVAVPGGLYLVELKGHPGRVVNSGDTWSVVEDGASRPRTLRNPLHLTDLKCKELRSRLQWAADQLQYRQRIPWIEPAVFLSAPGLRAQLDEVQRIKVYGRDDACEGLPWIWRDLLARPPQRDSQRITAELSRNLPRLLTKAGLRVSTAHLRFGDDWKLSRDVLDAGPTWEDRLATRDDLVREQGRVRIYLTEQQATDEQRQSVQRAARREYQVLQGMTHRGIAQPLQIREHQGGPAILFRHSESDLRLDSYLAVHGERLSAENRLEMVRQLAEAVHYAHSRALYHRALAARSVYVAETSETEGGSRRELRIVDWQAAARDFDTTGLTSLGNATLTGEHLASTAEVYLAPEFDSPYADPVDLDMFGLGALTYLIVTGQPPATTRSGLIERLAADQGLHPYAVSDGVSDALDALVFAASRTDLAHRLHSAEDFLKRLDGIERETLPEPGTPTVDPLTAAAGQVVEADWEVERVLGTGATARALLVVRLVEDESGSPLIERRVLKVALDAEKSARLRAEAGALEKVGGGVVVRLLAGPRELGGRTVLDLEFACGEDADGRTLGEQLRAEGKLSYHNLDRYGADLFTALDHLAGKGIRHRDLKPDNFGIYRRADRSTQLMLFDFSLADASERDVKAGTRGYLDPFLGTARRPVYDDHAERYAAAVTLHEMASGQRPVWGDGIGDPRTTTDDTPVIAADLFEPALRDGLSGFFLRAFHREVDRRFDTYRQMEDAWRAVFVSADDAAPVTTPATVGIDAPSLEATRQAHADAATLDTPLDAAGLTPRAVSVAQAFGAGTVGELLGVPQYQIAKARGAGAVVRKELNRRHKQWSQRLRQPLDEAGRVAAAQGQRTVEDLAVLLIPASGRRGSSKSDVVRLALALPDGDDTSVPPPWPTQSEVAGRLDITQASVSRHLRAAAKDWAGETWLAAVRDELVEVVSAAGRVMTAQELAGALRARHGSTGSDTPERTLARALAVVRAAVEAEMWAGLHAEADPGDTGPRLAVLRRAQRVLVALESLPGSADPNPAELADYAQALGVRADELVRLEPLPGHAAVVRELRAVAAPEGLAPRADTRLVELAAEMSQHAAASARLELYPRELDLVRALRISQAAAGVRREPGISQDDLLAKVRSRFPGLSLDERLTHVQVEDALQAAGFTLEYDTAGRRFRPPAPEVSRLASSSSTALSGHDGLRAAGLDPNEVLAGKLTAAVERGGFLALTLRGVHLPGAAEAVAAAYPVRPVHVDRVFLAELRALAAERGQGWEKVRKLDARYDETGLMAPGLASYVRTTWERVRAELATVAAAPATVLFLHHASLLARYIDEGGHELLTSLQNAARRPKEAPHGLWLLCPAQSALDTPQLDNRIVEVLGDAERVVLDRVFLDGLRASGAA